MKKITTKLIRIIPMGLFSAIGILLLGFWSYYSFGNTSKRFRKFTIDTEIPAQRATADIDGDGQLDLFAAVDFESGKPIGLFWYNYPTWVRYPIAKGVNFRADDMECGDFDNDGDQDLLATIDNKGKIFWYENPRPKSDPRTVEWQAHYVGTSGGYVKDVEVADLNQDGILEIVIRLHKKVIICSRNKEDTWVSIEIDIYPKEGMAVGDIDGDTDLDIALNGFWIETPSSLKMDQWKKHTIDKKWYTQTTGKWQDNCANVVVADLNHDGTQDVILSHSEKTNWPISWYESSQAPPRKWKEHIISKKFNYCETLAASDFDLDGDLDVIAGEMKKGFWFGNIQVFMNDGSATGWKVEKIANRLGIYDGLIADIDGDTDIDIVGCRDYNKPPLEWWQNKTADAKYWLYHCIDHNRPDSQIGKMGLLFSDVNHDSFQDIAAGSIVYLNPKGDLSKEWKRIELPESVDIYFAEDVDNDRFADLVGIAGNEILWLEALDTQAYSWTAKPVGTVPKGRTQGYVKAQIVSGDKPELIFTRGKRLFYLELPTNPANNKSWNIKQICSENEEEAVAASDIDRDGDIDLATVSADGHKIIWLENNGFPGEEPWLIHEIGKSIKWSDRIALEDVNLDGRVDVISTEETQDWSYNANVYWFKAPADPKQQKWTRFLIATLRSVNSMDTADMDRDGDVDIIIAEHTDQRPGQCANDNLTVVYENRDFGKTWTPNVVDRGPRSSHLGALVTDLDQDNDLDIVSIAWKQFKYIHLWENMILQ